MPFSNDKQYEYNDQIFEEITLKQKVLERKEFYGCTFVKCDFGETLFKECKFNDCSFENCNLSLIKVSASTFSNTSFSNSKVVGVNWTEASWPRIKLNCPIQFLKCTISQSTFFGLNLKEVNIKEFSSIFYELEETFLCSHWRGLSTDFSLWVWSISRPHSKQPAASSVFQS